MYGTYRTYILLLHLCFIVLPCLPWLSPNIMTAGIRILAMSSIESNASLVIISPDIPKTLIYCQSSSMSTTPTLVLESERSITSPSSATCTTPALALESESTSATSSPSRSTSSAISSAAEAHQLSPVVHAIGSFIFFSHLSPAVYMNQVSFELIIFLHLLMIPDIIFSIQ